MGRFTLFTIVLVATLSFTGLASAKNCETLFTMATSKTELSKLEIALERSDYLIAATVQGRLGYGPNTKLTIELSQDFSHSRKPSFSDYELTHMAQAALIGKLQARHPERNPLMLPQVTKMWFDDTPASFNGVDVTLRSRLVVNLWAADLAELITTFAETAHHPSLGNQIFKISFVHAAK